MLTKPKAGERPKASLICEMIDRLGESMESALSNGYADSDGVCTRPPGVARTRPNPILFKNATGTQVDIGDILGIDAPLSDPSGGIGTAAYEHFFMEPGFSVKMPDEDTHRGRFGVSLSNVISNDIGYMAVSGVVGAKVYADADTKVFRYADVMDGDKGKLQATRYGTAKVLWPLTLAVGQNYAMVHLNSLAPVLPFFVRMSSDYDDGSESVNCDVVSGDPAAYVSCKCSMLPDGATIKEDSVCMVLPTAEDPDEFEIVAVMPTSVEPFTDFRVENRKLQHKTTKIWVPFADEEASSGSGDGWVTDHEGTRCQK